MRKPYKDYKSIIWLRLDSIGDAILSSSMLPYVKEYFSEASISVVCQDHIAELYKSCPFVDDVITVPGGRKGNEMTAYGQIKEKVPDLLLNSVFSVHYLSDFSGLEYIPERFAFDELNRGEVYTDIVSDGGLWELELLKHQRFLDIIGIIIQKPLQPKVWLLPEDLAPMHNISVNNYIVLFAGVRTPERFYSKYWEALKGLDCFVVTLGSKKDFVINQEQLDKSNCKGINLSGKISLRESIAIIKLARLVVGGETGLAHAACAVGTPNIILLGGGHYGRFMPYSPSTIIIDNKMNCYKCNWICKKGSIDCIEKIDSNMIRNAIGSIIK